MINAAGLRGLRLEYSRWLNSDYAPYMVNTVQVYDGFAWSAIWQSGGPPGLQDASWTRQSLDVSSAANSCFRVRFGVMVGSAGVFTVSSWNLDDVRVTGLGPLSTPFFLERFDGNEAGWMTDSEWQIGPATGSGGEGWGCMDFLSIYLTGRGMERTSLAPYRSILVMVNCE
jgi:hypothetical protein